MPAIIVKEYTWRQTDDAIIINAPLFGNPKNVDLFATTSYVKASYPPFILELFLWGTIIDEESECVLNKDRGEVVFTLKKADLAVVWPNLAVENLDNQTKKERRIRALQEAQELSEKQAKAKSDKSNRLQKQAVKAQINLDTAVLNQIDARRDCERKEAMKDLENWRSTNEDPILVDIEGKQQENRKAYRPALKWFKDDSGELKSREMTETELLHQGSTIEDKKTAASQDTNHTKSDNKPLSITQESHAAVSESENNKIIQNDQNSNVADSTTSDDSDTDSSTTDNACRSTTQSFVKRLNKKRLEKFYKGKAKSQSGPRKTFTSNGSAHRLFKTNAIFDEPKKSVPLPRKTGTIDITFSERMFPTPARESNQVEEQEWLEKQAEARRQTGFIVEDLRPEEQDPQWLKDKGDEFFKAGNYLGAISAYTHGIKLSSKMSSLYSNRSAAHYALGNYFRCTEDCSKALELMVPHCKGNSESRAKCHARRGAALCKLSSPQHGIPELEAALKLDPDNQTVKRDLQAAKQYFNIQDKSE